MRHRATPGQWYESAESHRQAERARLRLAAVEWLRKHPGQHAAADIAAGIGVPTGTAARLVLESPAYFHYYRPHYRRCQTNAIRVELHPHLAAHL